MIVHLILLLLMGELFESVSSNPHSVLERYEERLNSAMSKRTGTPRTVKRYKCVEEYVTYDQNGHTVTSYQGSRFTTTMEPPVYRTSGDREIRRKPAKKVTIAINRDPMETTTPMATSTERGSTTTLKPFDEMNDEEADRIIEEMYLKKKESHATESPEEVPEMTAEVIQPKPPSPPSPRIYATDSTSSTSVSNSGEYSPIKKNKIEPDDSEEEDYPNSMYHRGSRKRPYEDIANYDDYDDLPLYRPLRREYHMRRRRPLLFSDDFSDDTDFDQRLGNTPRRQTTRDLSPLRSMKRLRHHARYPPQFRPLPPPMPSPISLPVSASSNMLQRPMALPGVPPMRVPAPPAPQPMPLPPMPPGIMPPPSSLLPPQPLQPIQQQSSMSVPSSGQEVLKMKPILQANPQEMQVANEESCAKITRLAKTFSIKDVSKWARSNCPLLQLYVPTASCELIFHFIDSCKNKKFF
ncbi:unnamed protein product [Caenorhabditis sp. 36 PRJEB53466]|nr:unnamed protein product [Caenorhabditis sp. 36 PRJEB53466]